MRNHIWKIWARALGEKASKHKHEADAVAIIRTVIFLSYLTTNVFIIAGVIRHWNDGREPVLLQTVPSRVPLGLSEEGDQRPSAHSSHRSSGEAIAVQVLR